MEVIESSKGRNKVLYNGYFYVKQQQKNGRIRWICERKNQGCKGALMSDVEMTDPNETTTHNHPNDEVRARVAGKRAEMKRRSVDSIEPPSAIVASVLLNTDVEVIQRMGTAEACTRTISRARRRVLPPEPQDLQNLAIIDGFATTGGNNPRRFLLADNGPLNPNNCRIIVFSTDDKLAYLANADRWYCDGNFKMSPALFLQIYVIRVKFANTYITVAYCYMQRKTREAYEELFRIIGYECHIRNLNLEVQHMVVDFETAVRIALIVVFGNVVIIQGCFYHLTQSTWRKIQELGLAQVYMAHEDFRLFVAKIDGLAFLPVNDVVMGMAFLRQNIYPHPEAVNLLNYFDGCYVNGTWRQVNDPHNPGAMVVRHYPPTFPPNLWNVHMATLNDDPRTNNVCESWNNTYRTLVGHNHPSMWQSIKSLQKQNAKEELIITQDAIGQHPRARVKLALVQMQGRLLNLCLDYNAGRKDMEAFLNGVSRNIRLL